MTSGASLDAGDARGPFRWDLVSPAQLGTLLNGTAEPSLWFADSLAECAGKVLARSGDADLCFVGRSLDSMFDLLSGALAGTDRGSRLRRVPLSFSRPAAGGARSWRRRTLTGAEIARARDQMAAAGLAPRALARRGRPATFVDVVSGGSTFSELFTLLKDWIDAERAQWDVIRRKLRFTGVTIRRHTSPNTFRWQQQAPWTRQLPASAVMNVSLEYRVWTYLADQQVKLTRSYTPQRWLASADGPGHDDKTRAALAEAVALVAYGRSIHGRRQLARSLAGEPALAQSWMRSLASDLRGPKPPASTLST